MNTPLRVFFALFVLSLKGHDYAFTLIDEESRPLPGVTVSAVFSRMNDPRYSSMKTFDGRTEGEGILRLKASDEMCLVRVRASKPGYFDADVTETHGLGQALPEPTRTITLPRRVAGIPLCYKDVIFRKRDGTLPIKTWVGFDLALGDVVRPWGKGQIADISFWNEGKKIGWTQTDESIERYRRDQDHARLSDEEFEGMYGAFRGLTRIRCDAPGNGIMRSPSFWPYCLLKMPAEAPLDGYAANLDLRYATLPYPCAQDDFVGYYLRIRTKLGPDGQVVSAHYAKIQRAIRHDYGVIGFRYYYNPVTDDRRLVHDMKTNLLHPGPDTPGDDLDRYRSYEP